MIEDTGEVIAKALHLLRNSTTTPDATCEVEVEEVIRDLEAWIYDRKLRFQSLIPGASYYRFPNVKEFELREGGWLEDEDNKIPRTGLERAENASEGAVPTSARQNTGTSR